MSKNKEITITFETGGYISQTIEILDKTLSKKEFIKKLQDKTIITTIQENGDVIALPGFEIIGKVINTTNRLQYFDFE